MDAFLPKTSFLFTDILGSEPEKAFNFCDKLEKKWNVDLIRDDELKKRMDDYAKRRCIHLVWMSDKFGKSLPDGVSEFDTYKLLDKDYDELLNGALQASADYPFDVVQRYYDSEQLRVVPIPSASSNSEDDRRTRFQLKKHLVALLYFFIAAKKKKPLSEEMIKTAHRYLMEGLSGEDGEIITAGVYRRISVHAGVHLYPNYESVPGAMEEIVRDYNQKPPGLLRAAWLLHKVLDIHPFVDGNGRLSRLLWCFSLVCDGLPFPLTPFPGKSKAYKLYIRCIERDQNQLGSSHKYLSSLTLISVTQTWINFINNLKYESSEKYKGIQEWLSANDITLS
jgi:fido (protein-threonine AMPylation protein)